MKKTIKISDIAEQLWKREVEKTLPNQKVIKTIEWAPEDLPKIYSIINEFRRDLWRNDLAIIDWPAPTWMIPTISHWFHPTHTAAKYPQWWPDAIIALTWTEISDNIEWEWEDLSFEVTENEDFTLVEFKLDQPQIDLTKTINTLKSPKIPHWKWVRISWRWPVAIATALAESYAHTVPYIANFQPWVWYVISISHSEEFPYGTIISK